MKIVNFNVRCVWNKDGINAFPRRAGGILTDIDAQKPDIIAFQEVSPEIYGFLTRYLTDYTFIGHGRLEDYNGEGLYIAFRNSVKLINFDTFWLSETPYVPASRFEVQSKCPRMCVDALFMADGKLVRVIDVHFDHISDEARILGIRQIFARIEEDKKKSDSKIIILGDFNATPDSETIRICNECGYVDITADIPVTFHNYGQTQSKIDYIYTDEITAKKVKNVHIRDCMADGIYLSDHYPISAEI